MVFEKWIDKIKISVTLNLSILGKDNIVCVLLVNASMCLNSIRELNILDLGMAILPRPVPTRLDPCEYSPPRRGDGTVTGYKNYPDTRGGVVMDFA